MNVFDQLQSGLMAWRRMGHGLWPIHDWPDGVIENYVRTLQAQYGDGPAQAIIFRVAGGHDLLLLIRHVLSLLPPTDDRFNDDPGLLLDTILFALIGLVYSEEPGQLTIEEVLMGF